MRHVYRHAGIAVIAVMPVPSMFRRPDRADSCLRR
jgi:hypothetical protein